MSDNKKDAAEFTLAERVENSLNAFLTKNKKVAIIVVIVIVVGLVALAVVSGVSKSNLNKQFDLIDQLETTYSEIQAMDSEEEGYQAKYDDLLAQLTDLASKNDKYPALKAEYVLGMISFEKKEYQKAVDSFLAVHAKAEGNYLGSLSLSNAAASAEELGNDSLALEYYTQLIDEFGFTAAESPKALFGQGRLQEKSNNLDLAKATFQQLADQFPSSEYAKLAINRLALL
ncbi:MAG: tetratricopeptide repeat protein [Sphaerochaeta sp.]|nr:tetratricopeptide repeat protein [Sphaerochaeta sp.]